MTARSARGAAGDAASTGPRRRPSSRSGQARGRAPRAGSGRPSPAREPEAPAPAPEPDGYSGPDWDLHHRARCGKTDTAVGAGLVDYGLWVFVVRQHLPEPAPPGVPTGNVLQ